jgi:hexosaminidase
MSAKDEKIFEKLLIPVKKVTFQKGYFTLYRTVQGGSGPVVRYFRDKIISNEDAYRLIVTSAGIEIYSSADAGAYYALQTLRDLLKIYDNVLPLCRIEDEPVFARRGVYLDCSRGKVPKLNTLKELVTRLSHWKINELQLYIENVFTFRQHPDIGKGFSPFTPDEILSLQNHCRGHHIKLVGSLASFGHLEKILSLPQYSRLGELPALYRTVQGGSGRNFPGGTTLCPVDPGSIKLISELYSEFVPLFDAQDFNVCCDETWELGKGRSKQLAERIGTGRVYLDFLLKIYDLCQKYGKRMNVWADIVLKYPQLLKELPKDLVLLNWEYEQNGKNIARTKEIADSGMPFMVCPGTSSWQTHGSRLPNSMANVANFAAVGRKYHAEGLLNTDWGDNGHRNLLGVSLHSFAHGAACSWNGKAVNNEKFTENFCYHFFSQKTDSLARKITTLGSNYLTCGTIVPNKSWLYFALVEPVMKLQDSQQSPSDLMNTKGLHKIIERFSSRTSWPKLPKLAGNFEQTALEELKLAERMDYIASRRALAIKTIHAGKKVETKEFRQISRQICEMEKDFKRLWLLRNKVSRLKDNLRLFQQANKW